MKDVYQVLEDWGIDYVKHEHPAVFTVEESEKLDRDIEGGHTKNLFLRNKKGDVHYLVTIEASKKADLKDLRKVFGESKLSFGSPERLMKNLGLKPGSVSLLGLVNDETHSVKVVVDADLMNGEIINCHPNVNTATLSIKTEDMRRFLDKCGNDWMTLEL